MVVIHASRDIPASLDTVWNVISNIDREPEFWHGRFLIYDKSILTSSFFSNFFYIFMFDNPLRFPHCDFITTSLADPVWLSTIVFFPNLQSRINVDWDIRVNGLFGIFTGLIKMHILKGTEEALERLSETVS